jgi:hypothetical protein
MGAEPLAQEVPQHPPRGLDSAGHVALVQLWARGIADERVQIINGQALILAPHRRRVVENIVVVLAHGAAGSMLRPMPSGGFGPTSAREAPASLLGSRLIFAGDVTGRWTAGFFGIPGLDKHRAAAAPSMLSTSIWK